MRQTRAFPYRWLRVAVLAVISIIALEVLGPGRAFADPGTAFDQANRLYEQGKYQAAIAAYRALAQEGTTSAALYFNLGNSLFKTGQTGAAIVNYRLAQRLAPRDPDIAANLRFARQSAGFGSGSRPLWDRLGGVLTLNELAVTGAIALWIWLLLMATSYLRQELSRALRPYRAAAGAAAGATAVWLALACHFKLRAAEAVVVTDEAAVRYGPFSEAQTSFTARDGAELMVLDRKGNWVQVQDRSRRIGWLREQDVEILPRG